MGLFDRLKGLAQGALGEIPIEVMQGVIRAISPVNVSLQDSLQERAIILSESDLNAYLAREVAASKSSLEGVRVSLLADNRLDVAIKARHLPEVLVPLRLESFVVNESRARAELQFVGAIAYKGESFLEHALGWVFDVLLGQVIVKHLLRTGAPGQVQIAGQHVVVDMKAGVLAPMYASTIAEAVGRPVPIIGNLRVVDILHLSNLQIDSGRAKIDFGVKAPSREPAT